MIQISLLAAVSVAIVGHWYRHTPRAWPESLALLVHCGCWAGMLALLRYASDSEAGALMFTALLQVAWIGGLAAADKSL